MTQQDLRTAIGQSLVQIRNENPQLNLGRAGERTLVFRLGLYLSQNITATLPPRCLVDAEYNIIPNGDPKALAVNKALRQLATKLRRTVKNGKIRVIPDILIHERNTHAQNFAVIEVKFADCSKPEADYVEEKVRTMMDSHPFRYRLGVILKLPRNWENFANDGNISIWEQT